MSSYIIFILTTWPSSVILLFTILKLLFLFTLYTLSGMVVAWVYLRFYQRQNGTKEKGDMSDSFTFASFFPEVVRPPIAILANTGKPWRLIDFKWLILFNASHWSLETNSLHYPQVHNLVKVSALPTKGAATIFMCHSLHIICINWLYNVHPDFGIVPIIYVDNVGKNCPIDAK